jgi:hypothetical protein
MLLRAGRQRSASQPVNGMQMVDCRLPALDSNVAGRSHELIVMLVGVVGGAL